MQIFKCCHEYIFMDSLGITIDYLKKILCQLSNWKSMGKQRTQSCLVYIYDTACHHVRKHLGCFLCVKRVQREVGQFS